MFVVHLIPELLSGATPHHCRRFGIGDASSILSISPALDRHTCVGYELPSFALNQAFEPRMDVMPSRNRLDRSRFVAAVVRYVLTAGALIAVMVLLPRLGLPDPMGSLLGLAAFVTCAWYAGIWSALSLAPLLMLMVRLQQTSAEARTFTAEDLMEFVVLTTIASGAGLAGQYRRRYRASQAKVSQRLKEQSRALALAHIVFCDTAGRITEWSGGAERLFGWTRAEAVGRELHQLLRSRFPISLEQIQHEVLSTGEWQGEIVHHRQDGAEVIAAAHWILYRDSAGHPIGIAQVHNDITELRRAEAVIRESDRRKNEFLATLAHELRNPLAPIRTGLELMKMIEDDPALLERTRGTMERQTKLLITLVDDLLDVSRITRGKLELRLSRVDLCDSIQAAIDASRPFIDEAGHALAVSRPPAPILVDGDPHRLTQIFSNLLINAAKYMPEGGRIELVVEREADEAKISVRDSGIGIAPDMLEEIFEMFTQVDQPADKMRTGLGIGLTLVKSLVAMHGGSVQAESAGSNQGSTFTVRLPLLKVAPDDGTAGVINGNGAAASRKVLIVDDNRPAAELLSTIVTMLGHEVRAACDGRQAIEVAQDFVPEIVLMDLGMPRMNGFEAAKHIWERPGCKNARIVALSGWGQERDRKRTREAGFSAHLVKPVEMQELRQLFVDLEQAPSNNGEAPLAAHLVAE